MLSEHLNERKFYLETCKIKINMITIWIQTNNDILKKNWLVPIPQDQNSWIWNKLLG